MTEKTKRIMVSAPSLRCLENIISVLKKVGYEVINQRKRGRGKYLLTLRHHEENWIRVLHDHEEIYFS